VTPDGIQEKFNLYRKWFRTLLVKEFLNLPMKYQDRFLVLLRTFLKDCEKVHKDAKRVQEKVIAIKVTRILSPDNKDENYIICGETDNSQDEIRMSVPVSKPQPKIGAKLYHTIYSINGDVWFSSKEELITHNT
jgi:hypothetical protein